MAARKMQDKEDKSTGRPTDYKPEYAAQAEKLCELGATDAQIADFFGVSTRTVYRWKATQTSFSQALKVGKTHADNQVQRSLYQKAVGHDVVETQAIKVKDSEGNETVEVVEVTRHIPAETTACIFWLKNRLPNAWRDKVEHNHKVDDEDKPPVTDEERAKAAAVLLAKQAVVDGWNRAKGEGTLDS